MSDEIKVGDETYISSKRASEITRYSRDYIGQLARRGLVEARRIGGLWYIMEKSLLAYKREAEAFEPEPPQNPKRREEPETIVSFDGKEYVSATKASEVTGYHQDYVSQLARNEKIHSRQIGTRWYVDREALLSHKKQKDALLAAVQAESVGIRPRKVSARDLAQDLIGDAYSGAGPYMTYTHDEGDLLPIMPSGGYSDFVSRDDEMPRSVQISSLHSIPIRKIDVPELENSRISNGSRLHVTRKRRSVRSARLSVAAATIVIVVVVGYVSFQSSAVYTKSEAKDGNFALVVYAAGVMTAIGDFIENIVAPEMLYIRRN